MHKWLASGTSARSIRWKCGECNLEVESAECPKDVGGMVQVVSYTYTGRETVKNSFALGVSSICAIAVVRDVLDI